MNSEEFQNVVESVDCRLCAALVEGELSVRPSASNQLFRVWEHQVMLPARGQLLENHALIITKRHFTSYGSASEPVVQEYRMIERRARELFPDFLEIEHGSSSDGQGGGCINHAHLHWFIGIGHLLPMLALSIGAALTERRGDDVKHASDLPYLEIRNDKFAARFEGFFKEGQIVRRSVAKLLSLKNWDWRTAAELKSEKALSAWDRL